MNRVENCSTCRFWKEVPVKRTGTVKTYGECKRDTPSMDHRGYGVWPLVSSNDYCFKGENRRGLLTEDISDSMEYPS